MKWYLWVKVRRFSSEARLQVLGTEVGPRSIENNLNKQKKNSFVRKLT